MGGENNILIFEQVTKWHRYGSISADRIDLKLKKGNLLLIYCRSEECLTDMFEIASGLAPPDEGKVYRSKKMSFIPREFPYMENLDVLDYVMLPLLIAGEKKKDAYVQAKSMLKESELGRKSTVKAQFLSGPEKCELMLLMACIMQPDGILIGNCSRCLDRASEEMFWRNIAMWQEKFKCAVLAFSDYRDLPLGFHEVYELSEGKLCRR